MNRGRLLLMFCFILLSMLPFSRAKASEPVLRYATLLGGTGYDSAGPVVIDADRSTWIGGFTSSPDFPTIGDDGLAGSADAFLMKLDPSGRPILSVIIGGSGFDEILDLAIDSAGNVYAAGFTESSDFPTTAGAFQSMFGGGPSGQKHDAVVVKLDREGNLVYSTYLGGSQSDRAFGIAADESGRAIVVGETASDDFPLRSGAVQNARAGGFDQFIVTLSSAGDEILHSTLLGGPGDDRGLKVAVDAAGAAYVSGWIRSAGSFPVTDGAFQTSRPGRWDGTVTKFAADGSALLYSTYLGGSDDEIAGDIEIDREGNAYVSGLTCSSDFPVTAGAAQPASGGKCDGFVTRLSADGTSASFSTYVGASGNDEVFEVDVDLEGNVWVTGSTDAPALSTTDDAFQRSVRGPNDAFIAKLSPDGRNLLYRSLIGGDGDGSNGRGHDHVFGFGIDNGGNLRFAGSTRSAEGFPTTVDAYQSAFGGGENDAIFGILSPRRDAFDSEKLIVPVVGSTPGSLGSFFKTGVQLHNPLDQIISGRIVFRPQNGTDSVDETNYFLGPRETLSFPDLLPIMGASGLGSVDVLTPEGQAPRSVIRIFNDGGDAGTTGMTEDALLPSELLSNGVAGVLLAPIDPERMRFNIGVRAGSDGAAIRFNVRSASGSLRHETARSYGPDAFEQRSALDTLGIPLGPNESVQVEVFEGSAVVYGAITDNVTQDPSLQIATAADSVEGERRVIPVVGSLAGSLGSFFRTAVQLHNPHDTRIEGTLLYRAAGRSGGPGDPSLAYDLEPGETIGLEDLLPAMNLSGIGSVDLISGSGALPVSVVRIFNDAGEMGTTGMSEEQVSLDRVLSTGERGILIAPPDPERSRFNIGIRTLEEGAEIDLTVRDSSGSVIHETSKTFAETFFAQTTAADFCGISPGGSDVIEIRVRHGRAIVYGATTDNLTQDPSLQMAE